MKYYKYQIYGSAHQYCPTETFFGLFTLEDDSMVEIPQEFPFGGIWGVANVDNVPINEDRTVPVLLELVYLSIVESKFYGLSLPINAREISKLFEYVIQFSEDNHPIKLIVGMAPYGKIALWVGTRNKQLLLGWLKSNEVSIDMNDFLPQRPNITIEDYCRSYIDADISVIRKRSMNNCSEHQFLDKYMQQFTYRYLPQFEKWNDSAEEWTKYKEDDKQIPEFEYIEESLYDGTHDKLHDDGLLKYHEAGKPKKLAIKWHIKKSEYTAYFWFEDERICSIFERFYGAHPETKTDFIIHIDAEQKKYELALFRQGLKEPQIIPEDAYQLLVFKNKFEHYRSDNYNQERGAWIW